MATIPRPDSDDVVAHGTGEQLSEVMAWVQPLGMDDAYSLESSVTYGGKTWTSAIPFNVWIPGISGWVEQTTIASV